MKPPPPRSSPLSLAIVALALFANCALPFWTLLRAIREPPYRAKVEDQLAALPPAGAIEEGAASVVRRLVSDAPLRPRDRDTFGSAADLAARQTVRRFAATYPVALAGLLLLLGAAFAALSHWPDGPQGDRWYSPLASSQAKRWAFTSSGLAVLLPPLILGLSPPSPPVLWVCLGLAVLAALSTYVYLSRLPHRV